MPTWFIIAISCILIYLTFIVWAQVRFDSYSYALSYLKGARLQVWPAVKAIGVHRLGESFETTVTLRNHGGSAVEVVGALVECSCIAHRGLPATLAPGGSTALPVHIHFGDRAGDWHQAITYVTNDARQPRLRAELTARVVP